MEAKTEGIHLQMKEHQGLPATGRSSKETRKDPCLEHGLADTLILDFCTPDPRENTFLLFKPPSLRHFATAVLANEHKNHGGVSLCCS